MDLVVARDAHPIGAVHHAGAAHARVVAAVERYGAANEPDAMTARLAGEECLLRTAAFALAHAHLVRRALAENAEILRQHDELRVSLDRLRDQRPCRAQI